MISQKFDGGDASENCDFQRGKQRLVWCKIFKYHKMALLFRWTKFEIEKQNMSGNLENHKMALLFRWTKFEIKNKTCQENESHITAIEDLQKEFTIDISFQI